MRKTIISRAQKHLVTSTFRYWPNYYDYFSFYFAEDVKIGAALLVMVITFIVALLALLQNTRKSTAQRLILTAHVVFVILASFFMINNNDQGANPSTASVVFEYIFLVLYCLTIVGSGVYSTIVGIRLEDALEPAER